MQRHLVLAIAAAAALLGAGAAQAARIDFAVGIPVPSATVVVGTPGIVGFRERPPLLLPAAVNPPVVVAPRHRIWLPPLPPFPRLPPPPWAWHHGDRFEGWREADRRDWREADHRDWREADHRDWHGDGRHEGQRDDHHDDHHDGHGDDHGDDHRDDHRDGGRDAGHRGKRGPW